MRKAYRPQHLLDLDLKLVDSLVVHQNFSEITEAFRAQDLFLSKNLSVRNLGGTIQITDYYSDQMYSLRKRNNLIAVYKTAHEISEEDITILDFLHRYRMLTAEQIACLTMRHGPNTRARLVRLYGRSYISRRRLEVGGKFCYWILRKGKVELADKGKISDDEVNLRVRVGELNPASIAHELMISDIHSGLERACRNSHINLLEFKQGERHLKMEMDVKHPDGTVKTSKFVPDAYFILEDTRESNPKRREKFFFLEAQRTKLNRKRFQESKVLRYKKIHEIKVFEKKFHRPKFYVLTVGYRPGMTAGMCQAAHDVLLDKDKAKRLREGAPEKDATAVGGNNYFFQPIEPFLAEDPKEILSPIFQTAYDCRNKSHSLMGSRRK